MQELVLLLGPLHQNAVPALTTPEVGTAPERVMEMDTELQSAGYEPPSLS